MQQNKIKDGLDRDYLIDKLTDELPVLRAKIGITQDKLCDIVGISRQAYSPIETKKKKMPWNVFMVLLFFYSHNKKTKQFINTMGLFPKELADFMNYSRR